VPLTGNLHLPYIAPRIRLPVRLPCLSRFVHTVASPCNALRRTTLAHASNDRFRLKTVIRAVDLWSIEDTAVIELLLTRPERKVER